MSLGGTSSYAGLDGTPGLVRQAVRVAETLGFDLCVRPETGRLLAILAGGLPDGSLVGETGTGTGAGLGWMVSAARPSVRFVSYEIDAERAAACRHVFQRHSNVEVVHGDASTLFGRGPFDLLVHDGGPGSAKHPGDTPIDPAAVLRPGGLMTVDDFTPSTTWPPTFEGSADAARVHWLQHPDLRCAEVRVAPDLAVVVGTYLPERRERSAADGVE